MSYFVANFYVKGVVFLFDFLSEKYKSLTLHFGIFTLNLLWLLYFFILNIL